MKKNCVAILLCLLSVFSLQAQENFSITGVIKDKSGEPLINAVVFFCSSADSLRTYPAVCDAEGFFQTALPKGKYSYYVSYVGENYYPMGNNIELMNGNINLDTIIIELSTVDLEGVTVTAKKPFVTYKGSSAVYNLSANKAAVGGSLLDGVKYLPGVQIKSDMGLSMYGFYDLTVAINNQVLKLSKEEIGAYLSSMSVDDIESVELIRNPGPEYGKQVTAVLNIITKRKVEDGVNAFLSSNISYQKSISENISARVNINKSITKNYLSYNFSQNRKHETLVTNIGTDSSSILPKNMHQVQLGSEVAVSSKHIIGARGVFSYSDENFFNNNINTVDLKRSSISANLYNIMNGKKWRWTTDFNFTNSNSSRDYYSSNQDDRFNYLRVVSDYVYSFAPSLSVQIGGIWNKSQYNTEFSSKNSNIDYSESNFSAYTAFYYRKEKIDANGGVQFNSDNRESDVLQNSKSNILNWQPYFNIGYNVAKNHRVALSFSTYYNRPAFRDMLPYVSTSSTFLNRIGNPDLLNSTRYNLALTYTFMRAAILEFSLSNENNPIVEYILEENNTFILAKTNLDNSKYARVLVGLPVPIINKNSGLQWIASTYFAYHYQQDKGMLNNENYRKYFSAYYVQHKHSFTLPSQWYMDAQVTYYSPLYFGVYKTEKQWWIDFSLSKRINNWKFSLTGYDLFNTNIARGDFNTKAQKINFTKNWHSPKITFGVSLTLGNKSLKEYKNRKGVDSEKRVNQNANEGISFGNK